MSGPADSSTSEIDASGDLKRVGEVVQSAAQTALAPTPSVVVVDATKPLTETNGTHKNGSGNGHAVTAAATASFNFIVRSDAPTCAECGSIMVPNGSCHKCINCGTTSGCS